MGTPKSPTQRLDDLDERIDAALARWPRPDRRCDGGSERIARILARIQIDEGGASRAPSSSPIDARGALRAPSSSAIDEGGALRAPSSSPVAKGSCSNERVLLNAPVWADALPLVRSAKAPGHWVVAGGAATIVLAAAAAVFLVSGMRRAPPLVPSVAPTPVLVAVAATPSVEVGPDDSVAPSSLPRAPRGDVGSGTDRGSVRQARSMVSLPMAANTAPDAASPSIPANRGLETAIPVGADLTGGGAADSESVPLRPAAGAVESALAQVLPGARACLQPGQGAVVAAITFGSNGQVKDVAVGGTGANDPAAACVRAALASARVGPFAMPAFVWTSTVRGR